MEEKRKEEEQTGVGWHTSNFFLGINRKKLTSDADGIDNMVEELKDCIDQEDNADMDDENFAVNSKFRLEIIHHILSIFHTVGRGGK